MARRSSDPARVREKILKLATEEFARIGFEGARVDRIAERCQVSKNMLYYYFQSKEGLFVAALERMYEGLREQQRTPRIARQQYAGGQRRGPHVRTRVSCGRSRPARSIGGTPRWCGDG